MPSNFTLTLEDAHLTLAPGTFCNLFRADGVTNVTIVGIGRAVLDGGVYNGLNERNAGRDGRPPIWVNNLLLFTNVRGFRVEGLHVRRQRWWAFNFVGCSDGLIRDIDFLSHHDSLLGDGTRIGTVSRANYGAIAVKNSDGIDLRAGCHDILVENVSGFCEDDSVALTCLPGHLERQFLPPNADFAIQNVTVRNVRTASLCSNVRLLAQGGGRLQNILVEGVEDVSDGKTFMTGRGEAGVNLGDARLYGETPARAGDVRGVTIRNVRSRAPVGVWLRGLSSDVVVEDVRGLDEGVCPVLDARPETVRPANTDEILVNPDMGLVMYHYSNRQWAYGQLQPRGDTLDWFPGTGCVYFRLPWCLLEPEEGVYRWDLFDSYAAPWIAAGKQVGFRLTCCESRWAYATPEWVRKAGAKGWFFKMKMIKVFGKDPLGKELEIWEPDYGDPVFLAKLENFLTAFARRYDGKPSVAFVDVGTIGMWGEGHTCSYAKEMKAAGQDPEAAFFRHYEMHRRLLPNTTILCIDDQAGASNPTPAADVPLMKYAHDLGFGFRDDSILVFTPSMVSARLKAHPWWFHADWATYFAPVAPTFVEHEHYDLSNERGAWCDEKLVESVEAYQASWLSIHGWPKACFDGSKDAYARAARRLGYRFELREATFPREARIGELVEIASTWVNVGVARRYKGATLAWTLLDAQGRVAWVVSDERFDFADAQPKLAGVECPVTLRSRCTFGWAGEIPQANDGVWVFAQAKKVGNYAVDTRVPTLAPGVYTLAVSLGDRDGTPRLALPLAGGVARRYPVGQIVLRDGVAR